MPEKDKKTETFFRSLLPAGGQIVVKPMFGHIAAFVNGNMFAGTFGTEVFVRLSDEEGLSLLKEKGATKFSPMPGRPMKSYIVIPPSWANDEAKARVWVAKSLSWATAMPPKSKKK
jgi:TfoX/Sxy family transcriptional regulator of competence genes